MSLYDDAPEYIEEFLDYMRVIKGRSEKTISSYYRDLRIFLRFLKLENGEVPENMDFSDISVDDVPFETVKNVTARQIMKFLSFEYSEMKNISSTRKRKVSALRSFYKALCGHKLSDYDSDNNPTELIESPSVKKAVPKFLELEDSRKLLRNIPDDASGDYLRDYCIITLFINCGMRLSELVGINISDIDFEDNTLRILGKENKERVLHLNRSCIDVINNYLEVRPEPETPCNALFLSKQKKRITTRRVQQIVDNALKSSGLDGKGLSTHKLRHTAATLMYRYGDADPMVLKEILGHASTVTTEVYTHLSNENIREALDANPLADETKLKK